MPMLPLKNAVDAFPFSGPPQLLYVFQTPLVYSVYAQPSSRPVEVRLFSLDRHVTRFAIIPGVSLHHAGP